MKYIFFCSCVVISVNGTNFWTSDDEVMAMAEMISLTKISTTLRYQKQTEKLIYLKTLPPLEIISRSTLLQCGETQQYQTEAVCFTSQRTIVNSF